MNETFMKEKPVLPLLLSMALPNVVSMLVNASTTSWIACLWRASARTP